MSKFTENVFYIVTLVYWIAILAIFLVPVLTILGSGDSLAGIIVTAFGYTCHQIPERSFFLFNTQLPVCSRCLSIHFAIALGFTYLWMKGFHKKRFKMSWPLLLLLLVPTAVDGFTQYTGMRASTNLLRVITGFPAGFAYAYFLTWVITRFS